MARSGGIKGSQSVATSLRLRPLKFKAASTAKVAQAVRGPRFHPEAAQTTTGRPSATGLAITQA